MEKIAAYPGTFDPITNGHVELIKSGLLLFDRIVVLVAERKEKSTLFTLKERIDLVKESLKGLGNVTAEPLPGLLVDYLAKNGIHFILRGLRTVSDFDYELQMALINRELMQSCETVFIMANKGSIFISSSLVKEIATNGGDIEPFVPHCVNSQIKIKLRRK
ncbi:MAG: pantetheine-phosphate adenylyltransferase [Caldisericaceae bacterium]